MGVHARIENRVDWTSADSCDQRGHTTITTPTGTIEATWSATGGRGDGAELISNTTAEYDDEEAETLLDYADLYQGDGTYAADIVLDEYGWYALENIAWDDPTPAPPPTDGSE